MLDAGVFYNCVRTIVLAATLLTPVLHLLG
jgi:hypothetical protein